MRRRAPALADHDHDHIAASPKISVPPREKAGGGGTNATPDRVGVVKNLRDLVPVRGQEVGVALADVIFALLAQRDVAAEPRTDEATGHGVGPRAGSDARVNGSTSEIASSSIRCPRCPASSVAADTVRTGPSRRLAVE